MPRPKKTETKPKTTKPKTKRTRKPKAEPMLLGDDDLPVALATEVCDGCKEKVAVYYFHPDGKLLCEACNKG